MDGERVAPPTAHVAAYLVGGDAPGAIDCVNQLRAGVVVAVFCHGDATPESPVYLAVVPYLPQVEVPEHADDHDLSQPWSHSTRKLAPWEPTSVVFIPAAAVIRKLRPFPVP
jgi:hypothetical protein